MKINEAVKEFLVECEIRRFTAKTQRGYKNALAVIRRVMEEELEIVDMDDMTMPAIKKFTQVMVKRGHKGTYINGLLKVTKSFIQYCYDEGIGGFDTKRRNFTWVREDKPVITAFKPRDVRYLLDSCRGNDFLDIRDLTIFTTFFETGIRCGELYSIKPEHIKDDYILITNGKNRKERVVPISPPLKKAMMRYERARTNYFAYKTTDDYYFLSYSGRQLTNSGIEHMFKRRGKGITDVRVSPHTCRHTWAQAQLKMGTDLYTVSRLLGHENIRITQIYLESLQDADIIKMSKNTSVLLNM